MSACVSLTLSLLLCQNPVPPKAPSREVAAKQELQRLQGSWQYESLEEDGDKVPSDKLKGRTIFFGAEAMLQRLHGAITQGAIVSLDPTKKPKTLNAVLKKAEQSEIMLGIYALEGDVLKICLDPQGHERPKEFKSPAGSNLMFAVLKRVKEKDDQPEIAGDYRSESRELDGSRFVSDVTLERRGDSYLVTYKRGEAVAFVGVGLRKGSTFSMSWTDKKVVGITVYQIEKGPRLVGQWTELGGPGLLRADILTPGKKDLPWTRR